MINISEEAKRRLIGMIQGVNKTNNSLRIIVGKPDSNSPVATERSLAFIKEAEKLVDDEVLDMDEFKLVLDPDSVRHLQDASIDYNHSRGFFVKSKAAEKPDLHGPTAQKLQQVFDEQINPSIAAHGGYVTLLDVKDNIAFVEFGGGCRGCNMINATLKQGVEVVVKEMVPEIEAVYDVTDHASGKNPYYRL